MTVLPLSGCTEAVSSIKTTHGFTSPKWELDAAGATATPVWAARAPPSACHDLHILNSAHQHTNSAAWLTHLLTACTQAARPRWLCRREIPEAQGGAKYQKGNSDAICLKLPSNNYLHRKVGIPFTGNIQKLAEHLSGVLW